MSLHVAPWARVSTGCGGYPPERGATSRAFVVKGGDDRSRSGVTPRANYRAGFGSSRFRQGFGAFASSVPVGCAKNTK
ncbi:hypothetical protein SUGI_0282910 [Cryptomeria japonica]|nr:hypothetical protein SUGI_0282910 [Cryptomeria japonica]